MPENQGFMSDEEEKETSFSKKAFLGGQIRQKVTKALEKLKTVDDYRNVAMNFSNQALQDDIFSILAEIEAQPNDFELVLPAVVINSLGEPDENPIKERKIPFTITQEEYLELSGFKKFFLGIAYGELRRSIHSVGDSIGELSFLNEIEV